MPARKTPTITILEGWAGGPILSRNFRKYAEQAGFTYTKDSQKADVLVAHSAGCYFIPTKSKAKLILLLNPPYWPGKSLVNNSRKMSHNEGQILKIKYGKKSVIKRYKLLEFYYVLTKPRYTYAVVKHKNNLDFLKNLNRTNVYLIRNKHDEFCSPTIKDILKTKYKNIRYCEISGYHGDYYIHPKPYFDLISEKIKT